MYSRVVPRDLFNEAKLLKCFGQLVLLIHDGLAPKCLEVDEGEGDWEVYQRQDDGGLFLEGLKIQVKSTQLELYTMYNSKESYPLLCMTDEDEIEVFYKDGTLTDDFIEYVVNL